MELVVVFPPPFPPSLEATHNNQSIMSLHLHPRFSFLVKLCLITGLWAVQDLIIPAFKNPFSYTQSPLAGAPALERDILFFFKGDVGLHRLPNYSRGIRQRLYSLSLQDHWIRQNVTFLAPNSSRALGNYSSLLARSKFCLVAPGNTVKHNLFCTSTLRNPDIMGWIFCNAEL